MVWEISILKLARIYIALLPTQDESCISITRIFLEYIRDIRKKWRFGTPEIKKICTIYTKVTYKYIYFKELIERTL